MASAAFVPGYSGGTATDSHRLPYSLAQTTSLTSTHVVLHRTDPRKEFNRRPQQVSAEVSGSIGNLTDEFFRAIPATEDWFIEALERTEVIRLPQRRLNTPHRFFDTKIDVPPEVEAPVCYR